MNILQSRRTTTSFKLRPRFGVFRGWIVVGAVFLVTLAGFGSAYTFSSFLGSLQHDFNASRGSVSLVFSLAGFLYFALGAVSGPWADRWGARRLTVPGMLLVGVGLVLAGCATTIEQVYAAYGLGVGLGVGCAYVPALGAVQRWFVRRRGLASGLAVSGIGVGTLVMPPAATWLIATYGWRAAYMVLGAFVLIVGASAALLIENDPHRRGIGPDGDPIAPAPAGAGAAGLTLRQALRTRQFQGLYAACLACGVGVFVPFVHLVPYALDHRVAPVSAALLLGAVGVGSTAGRLFLGGLADRMGRSRFLVAMFAGMTASLGVWALAASFWPLLAFALIFGAFYGGWVGILPAVVTDWFGGRNAGAIIGVLYTSVAIGTLIGPSAAGFAFDLYHSYTLSIAGCIAANAIATVIAGATIGSGDR